MNRHIFCFLAFLISVTAFSQDITQTIKGRVLDSESLQPLPGATVIIRETDPLKGTVSNMDGYFVLEDVPVGRHTIQANFVGYEPSVIAELLVGSGKEVYLEIKLTESITSLEEISVVATRNERALNEMATLSSKSFSVEETQRYAASISDPARMAQSYAGVTNGDDGTNQVIIRGNSPNGLLWRIEGVETPAPSHFAEEGYAAGFVSILNANMLSTSDFYTGAFPAEYNNAYSGVFDIRLRKGNADKNEFAAQVGVLGTDITAEGPLNKKLKASYLVNYRYSTLSLLRKLGVDVMGDETPNYQDMSFKINIPTQKAGTFSIWGLGGLSDTESEDPVLDSLLWNNWDSNKKDYFKTGMGACGVTNVSSVGPNSYIRSVFSASGNFSEDNVYELDDDYLLQKIYEDRFENYALRISSYLNTKFNAKYTSRFGVNFNYIGFNMLSGENENGILVPNTNEEGDSWYVYVFNQNKYRLSRQLTFNFGLSYMYMNLGKSQSLEPKASIEWAINPKHSVGFATGIYSRHEELNAYFMSTKVNETDWVYPNTDLKLKKTLHFVLSYNYAVTKNVNIKSEAYYQHLYDFPISVSEKSTFSTISQGWNGWNSDSLVSEGIGRNYGIELTIDKRFANNYYFMITASVFDSKFRAANRLWYNTQYNSNYAINLLGGREFQIGSNENKILGLNLKTVFAGGQRYTPIDIQKSIEEGSTQVKQEERFSKQLPPYFRVDFSLSYRLNKEKTAHIFSLDIQNITNRRNIQSRYYNIYDNEIEYVYHLGIVPVFNYKFEF